MKKRIFLLLFIGCVSFSFAQIKSTDLVPFNKGGKWGFSDINKKIIIPVQFDDAWPFSEGIAPVKKEGKWAYIDSATKIIIPYQFSYAQNFSQGYALVEMNDLAGLINRKGKIIIPCNFYRIKQTDAKDRWLAEDTSGIQHLFTAEGKEIYKAKKIKVYEFYSMVEFTKKNADNEEIDLTGLISTKTGEEIIPPKYESIDIVFKTFGVDSSRLKKLSGASAKRGDFITEFKDLAYVITEFNRKKGLFSIKSGEIFPCVFDDFEGDDLMENGFAVAEQDSFVYVIDLKGKKATAQKATKISGTPGTEWLDYKFGDKHGVMDEKGNVLTPPIFMEVSIEGKMAGGQLVTGLVLITGKLNAKDTTKFMYDDLEGGRWKTNVVAAEKKGKWGAINTKGKIIVPIQYKETYIRENFIRLRDSSNKYGAADFNGKIKLKCEFGSEIFPVDKKLSAFIVKTDSALSVFQNGKFTASLKIPDTVYVSVVSIFNENTGPCIWLNWNDRIGMVKLEKNEFKTVVPFKYAQVGDFIENNIILSDTSGTGVFNKSGVNIIPFKYAAVSDAMEYAGYYTESANFFSCETKAGTTEIRRGDGKLLRTENKKTGSVMTDDQFYPMLYGVEFADRSKVFYNPEKKEIMPWTAFDIMEAPGEDTPGLLVSDSTGMYAIINKSGNQLTPFLFKTVDDGIYDIKSEKSVLVYTGANNLKGLVSGDGKILCEAKYLSLDPTDSYISFYSKILIPNNGDGDIKTGVVRADGKEVVPCIYPEVESVYDDVFSARSANGYQMLYDDEGHLLLKDGIAKDPVELKSRGKIAGKQFIRVELYDAYDGIQCFIDEDGNLFYEKE